MGRIHEKVNHLGSTARHKIVLAFCITGCGTPRTGWRSSDAPRLVHSSSSYAVLPIRPNYWYLQGVPRLLHTHDLHRGAGFRVQGAGERLTSTWVGVCSHWCRYILLRSGAALVAAGFPTATGACCICGAPAVARGMDGCCCCCCCCCCAGALRTSAGVDGLVLVLAAGDSGTATSVCLPPERSRVVLVVGSGSTLRECISGAIAVVLAPTLRDAFQL